MDSMDQRATAIIPVKALADAKQRLAPALGGEQRRELAAWMFDRVLDACKGCDRIGEVIVVAGDRAAAGLAPSGRCTVVVQTRPGLDLAVRSAVRLVPPGVATLVVPADLPLVGAADLTAVCDAAPAHPAVVVAPTRDGGTGALLRAPGSVISTAFGPGSAAAHLALARDRGIPAVRCEIASLALDVDTSDDLAEARARHAPLDAWLRTRPAFEAAADRR